MDKINEEQLKLEIAHIFDSGANELRVFEMVKNFIDSRNVVNKNFVLADVSGSLCCQCGLRKKVILDKCISCNHGWTEKQHNDR